MGKVSGQRSEPVLCALATGSYYVHQVVIALAASKKIPGGQRSMASEGTEVGLEEVMIKGCCMASEASEEVGTPAMASLSSLVGVWRTLCLTGPSDPLASPISHTALDPTVGSVPFSHLLL